MEKIGGVGRLPNVSSAGVRALLAYLIAGVVLLNLLVGALVGLSLKQSREQYEANAAAYTQNLARVLEQYIVGTINTIDVALYSVAKVYEGQLQSGRIDRRALEDHIRRAHALLPYADSLRIADADAIIAYGTGVVPGSRISVAERDYFIQARDRPGDGLNISTPFLGKISGKWVLNFSKRMSRADGSFAGVVYSPITLDLLKKTFATLDVGRNGVVSLRDAEMGLIARHPEPRFPGFGVGNKVVSAELAQLVKTGATSGTYDTPTGSDNIARKVSFRRIPGYPFYVIVGLADEEYLGEWKRQVSKLSTLAATFFLSTLLASWILFRSWRRQQAVDARNRLLATVFSNSNEAIVITDAANRIIAINDAFSVLTGYKQEEVIGQDPKVLSANTTPREVYAQMWEDIRRQGKWEGEMWDRRKTGEPYPKWLSIAVVKDAAGRIVNYIGSFIDITERKASEERIRHLAYHDALTGLPNRFSLRERLDQALGFARRNRKPLAVMLVDLDRFKTINDTLGHHVGDGLLVQVAERLVSCVRDSDIVARLGGDEFVVVLPDLGSPADAAPLADKIVRAVSRPCHVLGHNLFATPSVGICIFPDNATEVDELLRSADIAMYHAKAQGRGNFQFFAEDMNARTHARQELERDLRAAFDNREFELHYQPQLDLRSGLMYGVEALVRWRHPQRGMIPPLDFIPVAEEAGLIGMLGDWILTEACRQLCAWRMAGLNDIRMSVNLSPRQFLDASLADRIDALLENFGLPAAMLDLEITESLSMESPTDAIAIMRRLTERGITLSIDDFGTGYSSLAYLKLFPVSTLKIDRSFVKDIETDSNDAGICDVTTLLAHKLGFEVVAEGVETMEQLKFLLSIGCERAQGYLISRPLPAAAAERFLRDSPRFFEPDTLELWEDGAAAATLGTPR